MAPPPRLPLLRNRHGLPPRRAVQRVSADAQPAHLQDGPRHRLGLQDQFPGAPAAGGFHRGGARAERDADIRFVKAQWGAVFEDWAGDCDAECGVAAGVSEDVCQDV